MNQYYFLVNGMSTEIEADSYEEAVSKLVSEGVYKYTFVRCDSPESRSILNPKIKNNIKHD